MNKDLLVICPTRGRPEQCTRMIKSFNHKSSNKSRLIFIIDIDDECFNDYECLFNYTCHSFYIKHPEKTVTEAYNNIIKNHYNNYAFYSETNDDFIYHTGCWDRILINKLEEEGGGIAYGDDGFSGKALPTTSIISGEIIQALGWIHMPTLEYLYNDVVWKEIGLSLKRLFYIPAVKIEHMHPMAGKAGKDETFKRTNSRDSFDKDQAAFREWKSSQMEDDVNKIKEMYATKNQPICK